MAAPSTHNRITAEKCGVFRRQNTLRQELKESESESNNCKDLNEQEMFGRMKSMSTMGGQNKMFTPARKTTKSVTTGQRKSLHPLQPHAGRQSVLVGTHGLVRLCNDENNIKKGKRKFVECDNRPSKQAKSDKTDNNKTCKLSSVPMIYEDPREDCEERKTTKSLAEEALELMVNEPVPESYWKDLAEERRKALEDALKENEELHHKVLELKSEVERLSELAGQAEYFASVIRELMNDKEDDNDDKDDVKIVKELQEEGKDCGIATKSPSLSESDEEQETDS
ncbi:uncharacterized protein [Ptychodera flava]|uniref:uncharacterized protein n=1 Tax=Ptychodera flava TaxID=63121 RepID=UPI00396AA2CB